MLLALVTPTTSAVRPSEYNAYWRALTAASLLGDVAPRRPQASSSRACLLRVRGEVKS